MVTHPARTFVRYIYDRHRVGSEPTAGGLKASATLHACLVLILLGARRARYGMTVTSHGRVRPGTRCARYRGAIQPSPLRLPGPDRSGEPDGRTAHLTPQLGVSPCPDSAGPLGRRLPPSPGRAPHPLTARPAFRPRALLSDRAPYSSTRALCSLARRHWPTRLALPPSNRISVPSAALPPSRAAEPSLAWSPGQLASTSGREVRVPPGGIAIEEKCERTRSSVGSSAGVQCTARCR